MIRVITCRLSRWEKIKFFFRFVIDDYRRVFHHEDWLEEMHKRNKEVMAFLKLFEDQMYSIAVPLDQTHGNGD